MGWERILVRAVFGVQRGIRQARASQRRQRIREYKQEQRRLTKEAAQYQKQLQLEEIKREVELFAGHLQWLRSVHKDASLRFDWDGVLGIPPPVEPIRKTTNEDRAREHLTAYNPGIFARMTGHSKERFDELNMELVRASEQVRKEFRKYIHETYEECEGEQVCVVRIEASRSPAYIEHQGKTEFFIRGGNSSQPLNMKQANDYIKDHFR